MTKAISDSTQFWKLVEPHRFAIEAALRDCLHDRVGSPRRLSEAVRYSSLAGGKRLRPLLVLLACQACGGDPKQALPAGCAVELIHTYSLVHDDLPAMDNDDYRRGRLTCHRQFDEATAILAGDGLLTLAFELLCNISPAASAIECVQVLSQAAGIAGMVGGQADDLQASEAPRNLSWLESLHRRKTGALLSASLNMGAVIAQADQDEREALVEYGEQIGLAFQIADDVLDVEGDADKMGKQVRKDQEAGKVTYPGLIGIEKSREHASECVARAKSALKTLKRPSHELSLLADYVIQRDR